MPERLTVVVSRQWRDGRSELAYASRSIAGAASRAGPVAVLVPGPVGLLEADGAFDLRGLGPDGSTGSSPDAVIIVDELTPEFRSLSHSGFFLSAPSAEDGPPWQRLELVDGDGDPSVGLFVPVNPLAERHRHHGFGFTGYVLVLSNRDGRHEEPPDAVAWLTAAFHDLYVVVVEAAVASAWKGRALRGSASVDTRMDLWRLIAHAAVCVDLGPGSLIARECIEALRLGTPIIVPAAAASAAAHARASGGSTFSDAWGLLEATDKFRIEANRDAAASRGRAYADDRYGAPSVFVDRLTRRLRQDPG